MSKIRVLIVEDSLTVRKRLVEVVSADPDLEVVAEAGDGQSAIALCQKLRPDVISLDMMLPVLTGLAVTEHIMAHCPTPILIVSASVNRGELFHTYDALAAGAVDVLDKPNGSEPDQAWERALAAALKLVSRIRVITHLRARLGGLGPSQPVAQRKAPAAQPPCRAVAIGASTGGPGAVMRILRCLPPDFPLPILLVIHIGQPFGGALAEWLDRQSGLRVGCAQDGEPLPPVGVGRVFLAPAGRHLLLDQGRLRLGDQAERHSCRPSVDVLFSSVAQALGDRGAACLLTGMGRDGAEGLLAVRQAGGVTIAQDEATSVVFGMPREGIRLGAAGRVLALDEIPPALAALAAAAGPGRGA